MAHRPSIRSTTPTQERLLEVISRADYRDVLRISGDDAAVLRRELACEDLDGPAFAERVRAWLGRNWILDVTTIIADAPATSASKD